MLQGLRKNTLKVVLGRSIAEAMSLMSRVRPFQGPNRREQALACLVSGGINLNPRFVGTGLRCFDTGPFSFRIILHSCVIDCTTTSSGPLGKRRPTISSRVAAFLDRVLRALARKDRVRILEIGMVTTHVHLLVRAHPTTVVPRLMQRLKGGTSCLAGKELGLPAEDQVRWAQAYTIQPISPRSLAAVREYVVNQARRHPHEAIPGWSPDTVFRVTAPVPSGPGERTP